MRPWTVAATIAIALTSGTYFASAQDRPAPPLLSPSPDPDCQRRAGGLPPAAPGETTGSANLSDELSRFKGVICPPAGHRSGHIGSGRRWWRHARDPTARHAGWRSQHRAKVNVVRHDCTRRRTGPHPGTMSGSASCNSGSLGFQHRQQECARARADVPSDIQISRSAGDMNGWHAGGVF